jgi:hypothetical protein
VAIELLSASRCAFHNHMHLDRTNNASKNDCENANTLAHDMITGGVSTFVMVLSHVVSRA